MRILIGTPVYDDQVTVSYFLSVMALVAQFRQSRPEVQFDTQLTKDISIARTRNTIANQVLADERYTHLLFIDADMGFNPSLIAKMIDKNEPVVGCVYPRRVRNYDRALAAGRSAVDVQAWQYASLDYYPGTLLEQHGDFARADVAGTGIMLIQRNVLERMRDTYPELIHADLFHPFAETIRDPRGGFLGEDVAFCRRWRKLGEIWVCTNETITHVGRERFVGNYQSSMKADAEGVKPTE